MLTTVVYVCLLGGLLLLDLVLLALFLWIGLRWVKAEHVTGRRVAAVAAMVFLFGIGCQLSFLWFQPKTAEYEILYSGMLLAILIVVPCWIIGRLFRTRFWRALQAWLPTLILRTLITLAAAFVVRAYIAESFVITSNAMAPTLIGPHLRDVCVRCGELSFAPPDILDSRFAPVEATVICEDFHIEPAGEVNETVHAADHLLTAKYLRPERWDLVVFRPPFDPDVQFVMRVVGLPGEKIVIKDGRVTADGDPLSPPEELAGITYTSSSPSDQPWRETYWGTEQNPAELADDEYFVLGDYTARSRDSRLWPENNTGRPAYALPASNIIGVVTHIYWPPPRWRLFQ